MKKFIVVILAIVIALCAQSCKMLGGEDEYYITLTGAEFSYFSCEGGATPIFEGIVLDYYTSTNEQATIHVDWGNGTKSSIGVTIPTSQKVYMSQEFISCPILCPDVFLFKGSKTFTIKVTMERHGKTPQTISVQYLMRAW